MTTEAEMGARLPEAKDCRQHQSLEEARKHPLLESSEGTRPCGQLDFKLSASRTVRGEISAIFSRSDRGTLLRQPRVTNTALNNVSKNPCVPSLVERESSRVPHLSCLVRDTWFQGHTQPPSLRPRTAGQKDRMAASKSPPTNTTVRSPEWHALRVPRRVGGA